MPTWGSSAGIETIYGSFFGERIVNHPFDSKCWEWEHIAAKALSMIDEYAKKDFRNVKL